MLKISDFAEIAQISTSALRYYDETGIFKPAHVDPITGYRFYTADQLVHLNRILALKDLGLDLAQIVELLQEELSPEAFQGMLRLRQAQLRQSIQSAEEQLARIDARLRYLEQNGSAALPEVVLKSAKATLAACQRTGLTGFIPNADYARQFITMLRRSGVRLTGYTRFIYHQTAADYEVEIAVPIDSTPGSLEHAFVRELPEAPRLATAVYHGSPYNLVEAYQALGLWIQNQGYTITGPCRKVCLQWQGDLNDYLTEIQFPVERQTGANDHVKNDL